MHRVMALPVLLACACGRIAFDARTDGGGGDGDAAVTPRSLVMPSGGQMNHVLVAPNGDWYATSSTSGAFRSTDQGMTWVRCGARLGDSIAVTTDGTVWMSGGDVGRSTDNCATWANTGNARFSDFVFAEGTNVWALCDTGLRKWNGATWAVMTTPLDGDRFMTMTRGPARYFIGTFNQGLMTSPDAVTWTAAGTVGFQSQHITSIAAGATVTYAMTAGGSNNIACSDQNGATWTDCFISGGLSVTVDPSKDLHAIAAIYDDLGETTDGFNNLTPGLRQPSMDAAVVEEIKYLPTGELLAATDRGVFLAPAGTTSFTARLTGLDAWDIDDIVKDGDDMWLSTRGGPLHSVRGQPFELRTSGVSNNTIIRHVRVMPDGRLVAGGRNLFVSADRGDSWSQLVATNVADGYDAEDIAFNGTRMFVATGQRMLVSDPPYTTFTPVAFPGGGYPGKALLVSGTRLWIGTDRGLLVSNDNGMTVNAAAAASIGTRVVRDLLDLPDGRLLVATQDGAWISDTARSTFMRAGLAGEYVDGLMLAGTTAFAATAGGVLYSRDAGATWTPLPGAETTPSSATFLDDTTGQIIVGTDSRGLIRVPMPP
ncbi:MAG TPA: hypothetical protein VL326_34770 [Kofleriaceae bacterium]|nr:hypothetical protein [Kofleriaceae bacterium]